MITKDRGHCFMWSAVLMAALCASCSHHDAPSTPPAQPSQPSASPILINDGSTDIQRVFESYRTALTTADGDAAASFVASNTIALYQEYRDLAVSGSEETLKNLSMINRMQVLLVRHRIKPDSLKAMDGKELFAHAVKQQWIGKDGVVRVVIGDIAVQGNRGVARVFLDGHPTSEIFHFLKENGQWKLDLTPTINKSDQALQRAATEKGLSENEFIFSVITSLSGRKVNDDIWTPPQ